MLGRTKKHPTKNGTIEIVLHGPAQKKDELIEAASVYGFKEEGEISTRPIPWREAFPDYQADKEPGACLKGFRYREGITQKELAKLTGIPQNHISLMENGKRPIGVKIAKRLGKALNVGYKVFL